VRRCLYSSFILLAIVAVPLHVEAHALRMAHLDLQYLGDSRVNLTWRSLDGDPPPSVLLETPCRVLNEVRTEFHVQRLDCPDAATSASVRLAGLPPELPIVLGLRRGDAPARVRWLADAGSRAIPWFGEGHPWTEVGEYLWAGARHVLVGADHLLFLIALLALGRTSREVLAATLLFTTGHAAALLAISGGHLSIVPRFAELAIALTLVVAARALALEAAARRDGRPAGRSLRFTAAAFGCIHGLGFAGALEEIGLQAERSILAIAAFNVGVELGQLVFIGASMLVLWGVRRAPIWSEPAWPRAAAVVVGTAGVFWCLERITST
jgi:hypothetical protein